MRRSRAAMAAAITLLLSTPTFAEPPKPSPPQPAQIDRNGVLILVRSTLVALQQANDTGNYTVLRDLGAPGFQQANNAARLGDIFASLRARKLDLYGVTVLDPQLTLLPQIEANGTMHMAGFFPSVPEQINFELLYAPVDGRWRPFGISVRIGSASPVAPVAASPSVRLDPKEVFTVQPNAVKLFASTPALHHRTIKAPSQLNAKEPVETKSP